MLDDLSTDDEDGGGTDRNDAEAQPDRTTVEDIEAEIELDLRAVQSKLVYEDPRLPKQEF